MADSPVGFNLLNAARFYGVGNEAFALLATGTLTVLAFVGVWLRDRTFGRIRGRWAAVFVVLTLLAIWWFTGCRYAWMRHLVLASALFYFFVVRIAVNLYRMKKDNSENASEENKNQIE